MEVWIGRDGERHGPYKEADVREWLRSGQVSADDLGWREGMADWAPLSTMFPDEPRTAPPAFSTPPAPPTSTYGASATAAPAGGVAAVDDFAGFWKRVAAYIIDALVLWIPNTILSNVFGASKAAEAYLQAKLAAGDDMQLALQALDTYMHALWPAVIAQTLVGWLYFAFLESSALQGTVGKLALGIRVTDLNGARIGFMRATGRYFAKILSAFILCIGFLMVAWTQRKQGLHDLLAQTLVLNGRAKDAASRARRDERSNDSGTFNA